MASSVRSIWWCSVRAASCQPPDRLVRCCTLLRKPNTLSQGPLFLSAFRVYFAKGTICPSPSCVGRGARSLHRRPRGLRIGGACRHAGRGNSHRHLLVPRTSRVEGDTWSFGLL